MNARSLARASARFCHFFRRPPGKGANRKSVRCTAPATHAVPSYYVNAARGHQNAYACGDCAERLRLQMRVVRLPRR